MTSSTEKQRRFEALVIEHHIRVRAFVRSLGVDSDWVDDIAQEAFLTAYDQWDTFDAKRDFGKWVRGIAANIVRNEIRKATRRRRILDASLSEILAGLYQDTQDRIEPISIEAIRLCLDRLKPERRKLIQERYRDGLSAPKIAKIHGLSATNIRQSLTRTRQELRACFVARMVTEA
jgi:RNA polymerase sigma-70 factor (ECF subfamily)